MGEKEGKECKIVCDGKEMATIVHGDGELSIKMTKDGKALCKKFHCCQ